MIDYITQLNDVRWLNKKKKVLAKAMHKCETCGCEHRVLEVHHLYYVKGHKAWQYPLKALKALCTKCHYEWHSSFEIAVLDKPRCKNKVFKPPRRRKKGVKVKYFKWQEHKVKAKATSLAEQQGGEPKYKERIKKKVTIHKEIS